MLRMLSRFLPEGLAGLLADGPPLRARIGDREPLLDLWREQGDRLECVFEDVAISVALEHVQDLNAIRWTVSLHNTGVSAVDSVEVLPLFLRLKLDPQKDFPRVRHLSGSNHYDATYPPRAFRLSEERFMSHDHCKTVDIGSGSTSAYDHVPVLQFAVGPYSQMEGFFVGFEWSSRWNVRAGWESNCYFGQPCPDFVIQGNVGLNALRLEPGERLELPRIHMGFFKGRGFGDLDNVLRRYIREGIACKLNNAPPTPPVYYDHWFGIHQHFGVDDLKRQADAAAELGCEIFCLDAAWYKVHDSFADGIGNWLQPDPQKFPNGVEELSDHVRGLGMTFGLWHLIETACPNTQAINKRPDLYDVVSSPMAQDPVPDSPTSLRRLRLDKPEGRKFAMGILRKWIEDWKIGFMRWECSDPQEWAYSHDPTGKLNLAYVNGFYELIDALRAQFPELYIEDCEGGGTRLDWGMAVRTHGNWLSDHTGHPDVSRFFQTGASRFWPAHFLASAVRAHRHAGDVDATSHNMVSRMMGPLVFSGDIHQWSPDARARAKEHVNVYKKIRHLLAHPVHFPLPQPRSDQDWDAALYGDETTAEQLLYVFRMEGSDSVTLNIEPDGWIRLLGCKEANIKKARAGARIALEKYSSALWLK